MGREGWPRRGPGLGPSLETRTFGRPLRRRLRDDIDMREPILVINAGSSSIKFSVFETAADRSLMADVHGQVEGIGTSPRLKIADSQGRRVADQTAAGNDHRAAIAAIQDWFTYHVDAEAQFCGVGHPVVPGGTAFSEP